MLKTLEDAIVWDILKLMTKALWDDGRDSRGVGVVEALEDGVEPENSGNIRAGDGGSR